LPGVGSGVMGLLRVAAVDTQAMSVPVSATFRIETAKDL
jgi:hypothetical protein